MSILIGGSGSSGSTLLRTLLNNHPDIFSGDELSLFNKHLAYANWPKFCLSLNKTLSRSCCTDGWFPFPEINILDQEYGWKYDEIKSVIDRSSNLVDFAQTFFTRPLEIYKKSLWVEKTPSNAYCFPQFLEQFPESKVVHMVRDPYDSITSLIKRGFSVYYAVGIWFINNAFALRVESDSRYLRIRYEDLCYETDATMAKIIKFIGAKSFVFSNSSEVHSVGKSNISSWGNSPSDSVSKSSIGGFNKLSEREQALIRYVANAFFISSHYIYQHKLTNMSFGELTTYFGYQNYSGIADGSMLAEVCKGYLRDRGSRIKNGYPNAFTKYPAGLNLFKE